MSVQIETIIHHGSEVFHIKASALTRRRARSPRAISEAIHAIASVALDHGIHPDEIAKHLHRHRTWCYYARVRLNEMCQVYPELSQRVETLREFVSITH